MSAIKAVMVTAVSGASVGVWYWLVLSQSPVHGCLSHALSLSHSLCLCLSLRAGAVVRSALMLVSVIGDGAGCDLVCGNFTVEIELSTHVTRPRDDAKRELFLKNNKKNEEYQENM